MISNNEKAIIWLAAIDADLTQMAAQASLITFAIQRLAYLVQAVRTDVIQVVRDEGK